MIKRALSVLSVFVLASCGVAYNSPSVNPLDDSDTKVRVVAMTPESVLAANRSSYRPKQLPAVFFQTAGFGSGLQTGGAAPAPVFDPETKPAALQTRMPPAIQPEPYRIGVGDVLVLSIPSGGSTVEQLSGLLAASNARQGYTVQDDGAIAIPNVGRVQVAGRTLDRAEDALFQRMVENQITPEFSLEVSEFNARRVSIGVAVARPTVAPITLTPLYLDEAIAAAGGLRVRDRTYASVRIYRDGTLYQIPIDRLYSDRGMERVLLQDGDSVFVDTEYEFDNAQAYFEERIRLAEFRQRNRTVALQGLQSEVNILRGNQADARQNFLQRLELDSVDRDYVYLTGEVGEQGRYPIPFGKTASLADALYSKRGIPTETGNVREIYVLRASPDPREFGAVTAWQLDGRNASNFTLATRFELRPNDVVFVAEQPVTRWGRTIRQITPSLITTAAGIASTN
ncbi:polysaccharide biosynthesis/export family protein [Cognatishimia sp. F0-27]|uniref:polysaccharide biosynthesis/export family protein n=1 Tax=Cognatishimia sp. F0-27 TaxID=2816855 RepID=UPI001D0BFAA4|nr:polysaccharide biosynthesis/export family protein [Cognatishimia sp. F0-27]MCC1493748.1 polysaccharide biosynthesis/export family protein [Cognatishimia sp. F0-27]